MKITIKTAAAGLALAGGLVLAGCQSTDRAAKTAETSFEALTQAIPGRVMLHSDEGKWVIHGPGGSESLVLSSDFSANGPDIAIRFDGDPFVAAGLMISKLPPDQYSYDRISGEITVSSEYGNDKFPADAQKSAADAFRQIVKARPELVGHHEEGGHYKLSLQNGNSFVWAKDMASNKTDMAFALNPKPLIDAGADMSRIEGWALTKMETTDHNGKSAADEVLMKGFNIN